MAVKIALCASMLLMVGCELTKPAAIGGDTQIIVFCDSAQWQLSRETLAAIFERTIKTPQPETEFYLQRVDISLFDVYKKYKNLMFIGNLSSDKEVSATVRSMLNTDARQAVQEGHVVFSRNDEWARGQLVLVLVSPDPATMNTRLQNGAEEMFQLVDEHCLASLSQFLYSTSAPLEDKSLPQSLRTKYGWSLRVHPDFELISEVPDSHYVRFHSNSQIQSLQRWISIHWTSLDSTQDPESILTTEWMHRTRSWIGGRFVDPVQTVPMYDRIRPADFAGRNALRYDGVWKTVSIQHAFGGAFRSYGFFDASRRSVFFIDLAVFFPEETNKLKYLRELDAIARTFTTD